MLGRIDPGNFLGGGMSLDVAQSADACRQRIAEPLGMSAHAAAEGIVNVATAHMAGAIRLSLFEKGVDPVDFNLVPFGGAAGLHACAVATELGIDRIVFPAHASTLSARGMLFADLRHDLSRSELLIADAETLPRLLALVDDLYREAKSRLDRDGIAASAQQIDISCDMRYRGQAYEITTPWQRPIADADNGSASSLHELLASFHALHEQRFAHSSPDDPVEIVTVRAAAIGKLDKPEVAQQEDQPDDVSPKSKSRKIWLDGQQLDVACFSRDVIRGTATIHGPAMIEEDYTILLIEDGWVVSAMGNGDLDCVRQEREQ